MAQPTIQSSFNSGEWAPQLFARVDVEKFHSGAALLRNFFVDYRGGASTRFGTKYMIRALKDSTQVRLIPFQVTPTVGFILEFGHGYIRVHQNGAPVLRTAINITGATQANPCVLTITQSWAVGDQFYVTGVGGMTQLNGKYFIVAARTGTTVTINDILGNPVDSTSYGAYTSGGTGANTYYISSSYSAASLSALKFAQNVTDMVICHPSYVPYKLTYTSPTSWALTAITFGPSVGSPAWLGTSTTLPAGTTYYSYRVTAVDANGNESEPFGFGTIGPTGDMSTTAGTNTLNFGGVVNAVQYNVYKATPTQGTNVDAGAPYGYIGFALSGRFDDTNIVPDFSISPPQARTPFSGVNPAVPAFFQQRLVLAAPNVSPQTMYFSRTGDYYNYDVSFPVQDNDAITASILSGSLGTIQAMVPQPAGLIVLTDGASWLVNGGSFGSAVTPAAIVASAQSFNGANGMPPIVVIFDMLYVQSRGSAVRDSLYNFYANVYTGTDISLLSSHLFFGYSLTEWAWTEEPYKIVWAVRNDGTLLALTFLKEQDFIAWTHHDTDGSFKSVATVTESTSQGTINGLYCVVERSINGNTVKYIERMADRYMPNGASDAWCVDAGLQYSGSPATSFSGGEHLYGKTCYGVADGVPITPFVMPQSGNFTLPAAASKVTIGLQFTPQLQTLPIDLGQPTVQSKQKKINAVTLRVVETLNLQAGINFTTLKDVKDLIVGNVGSMTNTVVSGLVTGDVRPFLDPQWTEQGQYCFQQSQPLPATILGVFPQIAEGDTK